MNPLVFYEKPGCVGNHRQKAELRSQGIELQVRDLLSHPWTADTLRPFFGTSPVTEWFNLSAPKVKSGDIDVQSCTEKQALQLMVDYPILIRRPLLQFGNVRQSGYLDGPVLAALCIRIDDGADLQSCPMDDPSPMCGAPS